MTTPADFYGVPLIGITTQVDTITITHVSATALSRKGIVSYPSLETAGASPTADVITVYDVTSSHALVLGTDYTLTASGSSPETQTYSVTRINTSSISSDGDTCHVTYRYGTVPDTSYNAGDYEGNAGPAPTGTAFQAANQPTSGSTTAGIGEQGAGGSLTDPANTVKGGPETGSPGSEYAVNQTHPSTFGYNALGSPDTEAVLGGATLPENFTPTDTSLTNTSVIDTTVAGGSNLVPSMYSSPPGYRAPSAGIAAATKDTTLTDILGNQSNATAASPPSGYAATQIDSSYIGSPAAPTALATQTDVFTAAAVATPYYLTQSGVVPSSITALDTSNSTPLVLGTDYAVTTAGNGPTTNCYVVFTAGTNFTAGQNVSVSYSWGDPTYWDSNPPASVPGVPGTPTVTAVNRGVKLTWAAPAGTVNLQYYLVQSTTLGTMYVPYTGQPVNYGQDTPSGGGTVGQPTFQTDNLVLLASALSAPATPGVAGSGSGSTMTVGTYQVKVTYVNVNGETVASSSASIGITSGQDLVITSPTAVTSATGWYAYVTLAGGSTYFRQQTAGHPTAIGTNLTLTANPTNTGLQPPASNTTATTLTKQGILTPPAQVIVRDLTSTENDPMQPTGTVLEYGYDYTVTATGVGPWVTYTIALAAGSVNAAAGDSIAVDYWYGADPSSVSAVFTQGLIQNTNVIYTPSGSTPYNQGYAFRVAAGNQIGLSAYSAWSAYAVPLNYNEPQSNASITVGTGSLDPANTVNPIYLPDGTVKAGTGLGG